MADGRPPTDGLSAVACDLLLEGVAHWSPESTLLYWNAAYADFIAPVKLTVGMSFTDALAAVAPIRVAQGNATTVEAYIRMRLALHANRSRDLERRTVSGKQYMLRERDLPDGGWIVCVQEITDLEADHKALSTVADALPAVVGLFDASTRLVAWNRAFSEDVLQLTGRLPERGELQETLVRDRGRGIGLTGEALEAYVQARVEAHQNLESALVTEDNRHLEITKTATVDGGVITASRDVTELRNAQAAREASLSLLRSVVDILPHRVGYFDKDRRLRLWNTTFSDWHRRITGVAPREGDDFESMARARITTRSATPAEIEAVIERRVSAFNDARDLHVSAYGREFLIRHMRTPDGGTVSTAVDVTAVVQGERNVAAIFEAAPVPMVLLDADGGLRSSNHEAQTLLGRDANALTTMGIKDLLAPHDCAPFAARLDAVARGPRHPHVGGRQEAVMLRADGTPVPVEVVLAPVLTADQPMIVVVIVDITARVAALRERAERARRAEELEHLNDELARSNQELDAFAYAASHDLKEPLRGIRTYAEFLLEDYEGVFDKEGQQMLQALPRLTIRLESQIESLLQFARLGRSELSLESVDLGRLVNECLQDLAPVIRERRATVEVEAGLPTVRCDPDLLSRVFANLVSNATRYNDAAVPLIRIGTVREDEVLRVYVQDNGIGIPPNRLEDAFRIFRRLNGEGTYGGGTGVGLTIARRIIERHGGRIWAESPAQAGATKGTTFWFTLEEGTRVS